MFSFAPQPLVPHYSFHFLIHLHLPHTISKKTIQYQSSSNNFSKLHSFTFKNFGKYVLFTVFLFLIEAHGDAGPGISNRYWYHFKLLLNEQTSCCLFFYVWLLTPSLMFGFFLDDSLSLSSLVLYAFPKWNSRRIWMCMLELNYILILNNEPFSYQCPSFFFSSTNNKETCGFFLCVWNITIQQDPNMAGSCLFLCYYHYLVAYGNRR